MDGQRFDCIVRTLETSGDRRAVLQAAIASLFALLGSRLIVREADAQDSLAPEACTDDADCLDGDTDSCRGATCVNGFCTYFIVDCISGYTCCGNGECCATGEEGGCLADTDCAPTSDDPCEGVRCDGGNCAPFLVACAPGLACCGNGVCCPVAGRCFEDMDCADLGARTRCVSGVCVPASTEPA